MKLKRPKYISYHKEPLTKLRQDTIKQMKDGGVI